MGVREQRKVTFASEGGWEVRAPEAKRASSYHQRQAQAVERAITIVEQAGGGTVVVHDRRGRIVEQLPVDPESAA